MAKRKRQPAWHKSFMLVLPEIRYWLRNAFHYLKPEARAEAVQDSLVKVVAAYKSLHERGKPSQAFAYNLCNYAAAQTRDGRRAGTTMNVNDVTSDYCKRRRGIRVSALQRFDYERDTWVQIVVADHRAGPAELVAIKLDFEAFVASLSACERKAALILAGGERTGAAARACGVSPSRISQLRVRLLVKKVESHFMARRS